MDNALMPYLRAASTVDEAWFYLQSIPPYRYHQDRQQGLVERPFVRVAEEDPRIRALMLEAIETKFLRNPTPLNFQSTDTWMFVRAMLGILESCGTDAQQASLKWWFDRHWESLMVPSYGHALGRHALRILAGLQKPSRVHVAFWLDLLNEDIDDARNFRALELRDALRYRYTPFVPMSWKRVALHALIDHGPDEAVRHLLFFPYWLDAGYEEAVLRLWHMSPEMRDHIGRMLYQGTRDPVQPTVTHIYLALFYGLPPEGQKELETRMRPEPSNVYPLKKAL